MKKKLGGLILGLALAVSLTGCSLLTKKYEYSVESGSFYVESNGQIRAAMVETFDQDYYDLAELTYLAEQQVIDYNQTRYGLSYYSYEQLTAEQKQQMILPVALESISESNGTVTIVFDYGNGDTFTEFNSIDIAKDGGSRVYTAPTSSSTLDLTGVSFVKASGGNSVTLEEVTKSGNYIVYLDYGTKVNFEHQVEYVSTNVTVLGNNSVQTPAGQGSYIVFK